MPQPGKRFRDFHGISAYSPEHALCVAASNSRIKVMQLLLADGVDINYTANYFGRTALNAAAALGQKRSAKFLIERGADLDLPDEYGNTPLMSACHQGLKKGGEIALLLMAAGADVMRKSGEMTALKASVKRCPPEVIQALLDRGAEVDGPRGSEQTALMLAARENNVAAIAVLLKNGADPDRRCGLSWAQGRTAEGLAELERRKKALDYLRAARERRNARPRKK